MIRRFCIAVAAVAAVGLSLGAMDVVANDTAWNLALRQLDDEQFDVREAATQKLIDAGPTVIPELARLIEKGSPEAAWRASTVLERMALEGDEVALKAVKSTVDQLVKSTRPGLARMGAELAERQKFFRHERAVAQVQRLGGRVAVTGELAEEELGVDFDPFGGAAAIVDVEEAIAEADVEVESPLMRLEEEAAMFEPIEVTFLDKFKAEAAEKLIPPGADLPPETEVAEEDDAEPAMEAAVVDEDGIDGVMIAVEAEAEEEEVFSATAVLDKTWRGGDGSVDLLRDVRMLTTLHLNQAPLTDKALSTIARLPDLQALTIRGGKFSPAALRRLHRDKPHLSLTVIGPAMMGVATSGAPCTVQRVVPGSGAEKAGLKNGDVIRSVDHEPIEEFSDLSYVLFSHKAGDKVRVRFEREGKKMETEATLMPRAGG